VTSYLTCRNCATDPKLCARRLEVAAAVKGTGITSFKHRCDRRDPLFKPGQRVNVSWPVTDEYGDTGLESWPATVIVETGTRFVIHIDDVDSSHGTPAREYVKSPNLFAKVSAANLEAIDQPARAICGGAPAQGGVCQEKGKGWDGLPPSCILGVEVVA
jgi:hypothetical protein